MVKGFLKLVKIYLLTTGIGGLLMCVWVVGKIVVAWKMAMYEQSKSQSILHIGLLVGTDAGLLVALVVLLVWTPCLILTWTTAFLFQLPHNAYAKSFPDSVKNGIVMAKTLYKFLITQSFHAGEIAAIVVAVITIITLMLYNSKHTPP